MDDDQKQNPTVAVGTIVALLAAFVGVGLVHEHLQSARPYSVETSYQIPDSSNQVESRLWQDPFEAFESLTNQAGEVDNSNGVAQVLWKDIEKRSKKRRVAVLGVMLPGGSYAEDKEVRLRLRYAVVMALSTGWLLAEDRTHIHTNSIELTLEGGDPRLSRYAYEWFNTRTSGTKNRICVLWLNEDDFADQPARRLGSLFQNIPSLTSGTNVSFYLIGPRSSDTLLALDQTDTNKSSGSLSNFIDVATNGHFHILSPEATASVSAADFGDPDDRSVRNDLQGKFEADIFRNWIASDRQVADLISQELTNRMTGSMLKSTNVVVLLSEQDTYYGSKLADEWIAALLKNGVCKGSNCVWQYEYLKGLDGSKPQSQTQDQSPDVPKTPEALLETAMTQQKEGQSADGDAQLDYVTRLGEFLKEKDKELKNTGAGRIIAFGFTGSDTYDKLILLEALRHDFPEAVFFTSDLDASLWTAGRLKYTQNLLVGSAYPLNPSITNTRFQPFWDEFEPFRDVYQTAVFRACTAVVDAESKTNIVEAETNATFLVCSTGNLRGGLYKIGSDGPVLLAGTDPGPDVAWMRWLSLFLTLAAGGALLCCFAIGCMGGLNWRGQLKHSRPSSGAISKAEDDEASRQMSRDKLSRILICVVVAGLAVAGFQRLTWWIATRPGEEPWSFTEGVSIWPSEYIRFAVLVLAIVFFFYAWRRREHHRKKLWGHYFCENRVEDKHSDKLWEAFYKKCRKRWSCRLSRSKKARERARKILKTDVYQLRKKAERPGQKNLADWRQAKAELARERGTSLTFNWTPPFIEMKTDEGAPKACVNAAALFRRFLHLGQGWQRFKRIFVCVVIYSVLAGFLFSCLQCMPTNLLIRGHWSHIIDIILITSAGLLTLFVLFYVLDATLLTRQFLDYISRYSMCWPAPPLSKRVDEFGVKPEHLESLLNVDCAAVQTAEIGPLIFWPVILGLLLLISRLHWFDGWTFPTALILIYVLNFSAAAVCWYVVRRAADGVRNDALSRLDKIIASVKNSDDDSIYGLPAAGDLKRQIKKKDYLKNLKKVLKKIQDEDRGAFANWFQDPTYFAVFVPSSVTGIVTVIISVWLGR